MTTAETKVENITRDVIAGRAASGSYLSILVATAQTLMGTERGKRASLKALKGAHDRFYAVVLRVIDAGGTLAPLERNRRGTFARSAYSTVRSFIRGGGKLATVDAATVSKLALRRAISPDVEGATRTERAFRRSGDAFVRLALRLARKDPEAARAQLERADKVIQAQLAKLGGAHTRRATTERAVRVHAHPRPRGGAHVGSRAVHAARASMQ